MSIIMYTYNTILQLCQYVTEATAAAIVAIVFSQAQEKRTYRYIYIVSCTPVNGLRQKRLKNGVIT